MNESAAADARTSAPPAERRWQSDVIVDLIKQFGFPYIALNPGASYRGLHDSLVNYGGNSRRCCCASTRRSPSRSPMAMPRRPAGRWSRSSTTWSACCTPPWASTTPMSIARRSSSSARPGRWTRAGGGPSSTGSTPPTSRASRSAITSNGTTSPASIDGVPDSFARAYAAMMTEPQGPIYMCYDAWLQEQPLDGRVALPAPSRPDGRRGWRPIRRPSQASPIACWRRNSRCCSPNMSAATPSGFDHLVALAETVGAAVYDINGAAQFSQSAQAQSQHGQERLPRRRPHPLRSTRAIGKSRPTSIDRTKRTTRAALSRRIAN